MNISEQELQIFSRHLILKEFNEKSFNDMQKKKISIIGLGGIGCPAAQYLVAAGIKILKLIEPNHSARSVGDHTLSNERHLIGHRETRYRIIARLVTYCSSTVHISAAPVGYFRGFTAVRVLIDF